MIEETSATICLDATPGDTTGTDIPQALERHGTAAFLHLFSAWSDWRLCFVSRCVMKPNPALQLPQINAPTKTVAVAQIFARAFRAVAKEPQTGFAASALPSATVVASTAVLSVGISIILVVVVPLDDDED